MRTGQHLIHTAFKASFAYISLNLSIHSYLICVASSLTVFEFEKAAHVALLLQRYYKQTHSKVPQTITTIALPLPQLSY